MKTEKQIIKECNNLARKFYKRMSSADKKDFKFYKSSSTVDKLMWSLAVIAYKDIAQINVSEMMHDQL